MLGTDPIYTTSTKTPSVKLEIQTEPTGPGNIISNIPNTLFIDNSTSSLLTNNGTLTFKPKQNMEKQIKVAVFLTEVENNEIISSTFLKEGWIRRSYKNANLNLLAVKEFNLSLEDLDKIVVKEIVSITF